MGHAAWLNASGREGHACMGEVKAMGLFAGGVQAIAVHAWDGYKAGTMLAGPGAGQWFCDFGFGPLVFF